MVMNFFKLRFIYGLVMKKYLLYFSILSVLILSWCKDSNVEQTWTWEVATSWAFDSLIQEYSESMDTPEGTPEETKKETQSTENTWVVNTEELSWNESAWSWEIKAPEPVRQTWFWVEECDRIIDFNLCIISKAPVENHEAMKESLQKAVEPWKLLANAQLREVCQKAIEKDTFKEVRSHYEALEDWCRY